MHTAFVSETFPPEINGVALTVRALMEGLQREGHRVSLVRPRQDEPDVTDPDCLRVAGAALPRYPGLRFGWPAGRRLRARWRQDRPDAVYVATEGPLGWSALRAARALGIPCVTGLHTRFDDYMHRYGLPWLAPVALRWMRHFHNRGQRTLVPTRELAEFLRQRGFMHMQTLGRAVDAALFDPQHRDESLRRQWGLAPDGLAVIHVGRIAAEKNLPLLVRAFRALQAERPAARLIWVGDGPERARLQAAHPDFVFCGMQRGEALGRHYASADLFLFPSLSETFGNVTLEAMASGLAVVAFRYGAAAEHLVDGRHGRTPTHGDESEFIAAACALAGDDPGRTRMGAAAREAVRDCSPDAINRQFAELIAELIRKGVSP